MMDAAQLAEELRSEQEHAQALEKERREQEAKAKDLQVSILFRNTLLSYTCHI